MPRITEILNISFITDEPDFETPTAIDRSDQRDEAALGKKT
jgi:hypothetical protein